MRLIFVGDSPTVDTGFSRCTRAACAELHNAGHEVHVLGINESGDPHDYPYPIYPPRSLRDRSRSAFGMDRLPALSARLKPDVVVLLTDPWHVPAYLAAFEDAGVECPPMVAWLAVDSKNHPNSAELNPLAHIVTWTQFAQDQLRAGGYTGPASIVPLGVDTSLFYPRDRAAARAELRAISGAEVFGPEDYIVGYVGRNQSRKRVDLLIGYFAEWITRYNIRDAYLYLKVAPTGESGCDIRSVATYYGKAVEGRLLVSAPPAGFGAPDDLMPLVYSAMDVYLTTTQGEGWGLCVSPDTLIQTPQGALPMRDISSGDRVMTQDGSFHDVRAKITREDEVMRVKVAGSPALTVTPQHPFLVLPRRSAPQDYYRRHPEAPRWTRADELREGDLVACPRPPWSDSLPDSFDLAEAADSRTKMDEDAIWHPMGFSPRDRRQSLSAIAATHGVSSRVAEDAVAFANGSATPVRAQSASRALAETLGPMPKAQPVKLCRRVPVNARTLELLGWFLAEGSTGGGNRVEIDLHARELPVAERLAETFLTAFGAEATIERNGPNKCRVRVCSTLLARWFRQMCGNGARNKRLSPALWRSAAHLGPLVAAYFRGDGYWQGNGWRVTTASTDLAWQIRMVLAAVGIHASVRRLSRERAWAVDVCGAPAERFSQWCGLPTRADRTRKAGKTALTREDFIFVPVRKIHRTGERSVVMDIEVDSVHSFVGAGVILHNTTHEAMACGVPCIVPDWSALGEWTEDAAIKVPCTSTALTAPLNQFPYTIGGVPDKEATIAALHALYSSRELRDEHRERGLALTARPEYQWSNVGVAFRETLERVLEPAAAGEVAA
jgi:glycosyltransferase involved in cell wall biosynthesis